MLGYCMLLLSSQVFKTLFFSGYWGYPVIFGICASHAICADLRRLQTLRTSAERSGSGASSGVSVSRPATWPALALPRLSWCESSTCFQLTFRLLPAFQISTRVVQNCRLWLLHIGLNSWLHCWLCSRFFDLTFLILIFLIHNCVCIS